MDTKERIADVALHMFSERGYEATSIRDICGEVGIKESTLYYHFKNKQDILDSLVSKFENHIADLLGKLEMPSMSGMTEMPDQFSSGDGGAVIMEKYMMDSYLFDPFCNLMLRLMMMEQFHNEKIRALYERFMFTQPYEIQKSIMTPLVQAGMITESDAEWIAQEFFSHMTVLTYKYLLNGELTDERKASYSEEVHDFYEKALMRLGNAAGGKKDE